MYKVEFFEPLTALEVRQPLIAACHSVARAIDLYANFQQPQQVVYDSSARSGAKRTRIGNGKHKSWWINFQIEPLNANRPTVEASIAIRSLFNPAIRQYGGFDYGVYGEPEPTYPFITIHTPSEINAWPPRDPSEEMLTALHEAIEKAYDTGQEKLF